VTGSRALKPSNVGIFISGPNSLVGGLVPGAQNVISGNAIGIFASNLNAGPPAGNLIQGNLIGLNSLGAAPLPNNQEGILISNAFNNTVGGTQLEAANKIAFNGKTGIRLMSGTGNAIRGNSIFSNGGMGIDLDPPGVTVNDAGDSDIGPNNLQNFPVLTSVTSVGNSMMIQGSLKSTPNGTFQVDFFSSATLDSSGNGEGALFLHTTTVNTNGNGDATIGVTFQTPVGATQAVTATATDTNGNTSEFSAGNSTSLIGSVHFSVNSIKVHEDLGMLNVTVLRQGGSSGPLTVDFATAEGTAFAGQDYTSTSGTLSFGDGETSKTFQVPILTDTSNDPDETFTVVLRNASIPEALGAPHELLVTIEDSSRNLILEVDRPSLNEGGAGSTTEMLFTLSLSAATSRTVSFDYATANQGAFGGVACGNQGIDYESTSGTATLQPGATSFTIPVKICGDRSAESNETILINFSNAHNAVFFNTQATGTILDDDVLELLHEDSGPFVDQAAALDALTHVRDPFRMSIPDWFANAPDRNTRVVLFVRNLQLNQGETMSAVGVNVLGRDIIPAEDVRAVPNTDLTQVVFRLPNNLPQGFYTVSILAHGRTSNSGTIRIVQ
jgi:hypothetical protein